jgi:hypothetical protein
MAHLVSHPLTMLSKLYDFWQVELLPLEYEAPFAVDESTTAKGGRAKDVANDDAETLPGESLDKSRKRRTVGIATDEAILYAKLLHRQGRELIQKHGDQLHEFMMEPLKSLYQADMMSTLLEFSTATQVKGKISSKKKLYGRSTNPSREGLEGLGKVDPKSARASYPKRNIWVMRILAISLLLLVSLGDRTVTNTETSTDRCRRRRKKESIGAQTRGRSMRN